MEQVTTLPVIEEALANTSVADIVTALNDIKIEDAQFVSMRTIAVTLLNMLGLENAATTAALDALRKFQPKPVRVKKELDPAALVRKILHAKDWTALEAYTQAEDAPEELKAAAVTVVTLQKADVSEDVIEFAVKKLRTLATPSSSKPRIPAEKFTVGYNGKSYDNLMEAIKAAGYSADNLVGESKRPETTVIWAKLRKPLLKDGTAEHEGHVFTKELLQDAA